MGWLLLWVAIGLLWLATLAGCGWMLWKKGTALVQELHAQGRTLSDLGDILGQVGQPPAERR